MELGSRDAIVALAAPLPKKPKAPSGSQTAGSQFPRATPEAMVPVAGPVVAIVIVTCCGVLVRRTGDGIEAQLMPRSEACATVPLEAVTVVHSNTTSKLPAPVGGASKSLRSDVCPGKTGGTCGT